MSWSFYAIGTKKGILKKLSEDTNTMDPETRIPAMALVKAAVETATDEQGIQVDAAGSGYANGQTCSVKVSHVALVLDPVE